MGLLDFIPITEMYNPPKNKPSVELNCERCGSKFMGYSWMLRTNKDIICPSCWKHEKFEEEDNK